MFQIQFRDYFDSEKDTKMTLEYREVHGQNINLFLNRNRPRRRRLGYTTPEGFEYESFPLKTHQFFLKFT